jgi:hypothetical protein
MQKFKRTSEHEFYIAIMHTHASIEIVSNITKWHPASNSFNDLSQDLCAKNQGGIEIAVTTTK